jgi:hypothetical protein
MILVHNLEDPFEAKVSYSGHAVRPYLTHCPRELKPVPDFQAASRGTLNQLTVVLIFVYHVKNEVKC